MFPSIYTYLIKKKNTQRKTTIDDQNYYSYVMSVQNMKKKTEACVFTVTEDQNLFEIDINYL